MLGSKLMAFQNLLSQNKIYSSIYKLRKKSRVAQILANESIPSHTSCCNNVLTQLNGYYTEKWERLYSTRKAYNTKPLDGADHSKTFLANTIRSSIFTLLFLSPVYDFPFLFSYSYAIFWPLQTRKEREKELELQCRVEHPPIVA